MAEVHPLRDMAERVGREVELFAEKLDAWRPKDRLESTDAKHGAALDLIGEYRDIAQETVNRLTEQHGNEQKQRLRIKWARFRMRSPEEIEQDEIDIREIEDIQPIQAGPRAKTTLHDLETWQAELATWRLVEGLVKCRYPDRGSFSVEQQARELAHGNGNNRFALDGKPWERFLVENEIARERLTVMRWLETTANETDSDLTIIEEQLEKASGKGRGLFGFGWMDTKEMIKKEKRLRLWDTSIDSSLPQIQHSSVPENLVTQLDPDAPTRQAKTLEMADRQYESSFWLMCFELFRRGKSMDEIREWCVDRNEAARALSLGAYLQNGQQPELVTMPIDVRYRWRRACIGLARKGGLTVRERAVYGLLAGDYKTVERVSRGWCDYLLAGYNGSLLTQYRSYLVQQHLDQLPRGTTDIPSETPTQTATEAAQRMLVTLQTEKHLNIEAMNPFEQIQAAVIGDVLQRLALEQGVVLARLTNRQDQGAYTALVPARTANVLTADETIVPIVNDFNALRTLAHMIVVYQELGLDFGTGEHFLAVENVLCAYIDFLRRAGKISLIPLYAARLAEENATIAMARVLPDVTDVKERHDLIILMKSYGLNVSAVLKAQHDFAMDSSPLADGDDPAFRGLRLLERISDSTWPGRRIKLLRQQRIAPDHEVLLRSLEWYLLNEGRWAVSFEGLTDVAKRFLNSGHVGSALELYERLPFNEVSITLTKDVLNKATDVMDDDEGGDEEKTLALRRSSRPRSRVKADGSRLSTTPHKSKMYRDLLKQHSRTYFEMGLLVAAMKALWKWRAAEEDFMASDGHDVSNLKRTIRKQLDDLITAMDPLLHEILVVAGPAATVDELKKLRHNYLPEMILAYVSALHSAGHLISRDHLLQCMDLATNVAENPELIDCFRATGRMPELVDAFALSGRAMLKLNENPTSTKKRRGKTGRNLGMWEISA